MLIIDVSHHNGIINWEAVKASGVSGAILRCGYGDNITSQDDKQFQRNMAECERLGIPRGVYIYSYAKNDAQARSEAQHVLRLVQGHSLQFPIYLDLEEPGTEGYTLRCAQVFCPIIEQAGYWCGIYASQSWWQSYLTSLGDRYTKWIARYSQISPVVSCDIWQYSADGSVNGIRGRVDMNNCYRDFSKEITGESVQKPVQEKPVDTSSNSNALWHRVEAGETLAGIAQKYAGGISVERLAMLNGIADPNKIYAGQLIRCDDYLAGQATKQTPTPSMSRSMWYEVKAGDTLSELCAGWGKSVSEICNLNGIKDPNKIYIGQKIRVY